MKTPWWFYTILAGILIGIAVFGNTTAHADPGISPNVAIYAAKSGTAVCDTLDDYPTILGVAGVSEGIMQDGGFTGYQAGQIVAIAVESNCPRFLPLLREFVNAVIPTPSRSALA
jgi:hypothetical protein